MTHTKLTTEELYDRAEEAPTSLIETLRSTALARSGRGNAFDDKIERLLTQAADALAGRDVTLTPAILRDVRRAAIGEVMTMLEQDFTDAGVTALGKAGILGRLRIMQEDQPRTKKRRRAWRPQNTPATPESDNNSDNL